MRDRVRGRRLAENAAAGVLLALFAGLATTSLRHKSVTGDEVAHLPAGYSYVATGDFRLNPQHPPLAKALAGLPLLALDLPPVESLPGWAEANEWRFGRELLTSPRVPLRTLVTLARLPMVGLGVLLGWFLWRWARELWGSAAALVSLALFALCPNLLAHTRWVTTDVAVSCFTVGTLWTTWRFVRRGGRFRDASCAGVLLGAALLAKYSGVITGLIALGLLGVAWLASLRGSLAAWLHDRSSSDGGADDGPEPAPDDAPKDRAATDRALAEHAGRRAPFAALLVVGFALLVVAVGFGFPHGVGRWLDGFGRVYADANPAWEGFLWGEYSATGFRHYYVLAMLWKTPLPTLALFGLGGWVLIARRCAVAPFDSLAVAAPFFAWHAAGVFNQANIGIRHVLPIFPAMILVAGAGAGWLLAGSRGRRALLAGLLAWLAAGTFAAWPHFLPWFNVLGGGSTRGIERLDDSNVEWGQDWWGIRRFVDQHPQDEVKVFAIEPLPRQTYGVPAAHLDLRDVVWPRPGVSYLVGAHILQRNQLYTRWRHVRFEWLARYPQPVERIGGSIFVYRFSIDPADRERDDVIWLPAAQWLDQAEEQLVRIARDNPGFVEAGRLLAEVRALRGPAPVPGPGR